MYVYVKIALLRQSVEVYYLDDKFIVSFIASVCSTTVVSVCGGLVTRSLINVKNLASSKIAGLVFADGVL